MKTKILTISGILIATNLLIGLLLSAYSAFNLLLTTSMLLLSAAIVYMVNAIRVSDAIKVSFTLLLCLSAFVKFALGLLAPEHLQDNWCLITCVVIMVFEVVMLVVYCKKGK